MSFALSMSWQCIKSMYLRPAEHIQSCYKIDLFRRQLSETPSPSACLFHNVILRVHLWVLRFKHCAGNSPSRSRDSCTLRLTRSPVKSSGSPALYFPTLVAT